MKVKEQKKVKIKHPLNLVVNLKKLKPTLSLPERTTEDSAAYDVFIPEQWELKYGRQIIPLVFALEMPEILCALIQGRSGYSAFGLKAYDTEGKEYRIDADVVLGLVDADYRGEIGIILKVTDKIVTKQRMVLHAQQAVAQMRFSFVPTTTLMCVDSIGSTERIGGFGKQDNEYVEH